jgi:hypothetical protein
MKFATSIPASPGKSTPQAGATTVAGKSNAPDATLRTGMQPKPEAIREAQEVKGVARKCIDVQVQGDGGSLSPNGNPKLRGRAGWGVEEPKS